MTIFQNICGTRRICKAAVVLALALGLAFAATPSRGQVPAAPGAKPIKGPRAHELVHDDRFRNIEAAAVEIPMGEKEPPVHLSLADLMELYKVPALSIAVIDDYKIVWAKGYGTIGVHGVSTPSKQRREPTVPLNRSNSADEVRQDSPRL